MSGTLPLRLACFTLIALAACDVTAPPDDAPIDAGVLRDAGPRADAGPTIDAGEPDAGPVVDAGLPWWQEPPPDADHDGMTVEQGDCDDTDATRSPLAEDVCNGIDDDCDGLTDEDVDGDAREPANDTPKDLGDLTDTDELFVDGVLFPQGDVDRWTLHVDDVPGVNFDLEVWLYDVPSQADYVLELHWIADSDGRSHGEILRSDTGGYGGGEFLNHSGSEAVDDSGRYEIVLRSTSGAGCAFPYTLQILVGGL